VQFAISYLKLSRLPVLWGPLIASDFDGGAHACCLHATVLVCGPPVRGACFFY